MNKTLSLVEAQAIKNRIKTARSTEEDEKLEQEADRLLTYFFKKREELIKKVGKHRADQILEEFYDEIIDRCHENK